ncbi:MAG: hypothetical protein KJO44_05450 [Gemmatimonadetes bacterium]|nr:hypothetical protein [Gemmatimonadota bacterium]
MVVSRQVLVLIGTRRGLFRATSDEDRREWTVEGPAIAGYEVYHAILDPRDPRMGYAAVRHEVWGSHVYRSTDAGKTWDPLASRPTFPEGSDRTVEAIWHLAPGGDAEPGVIYAGVEPAALFVSRNEGESWARVTSIEEHPTAAAWQPAKGGLALHSIQVDRSDPDRIFAAVSAGGTYRSEDGGRSWTAINEGVRAEFLADTRPEAGQCVHSVRLHPESPKRLYQQNHCGTYRTDDAGNTWTEITNGLPSDFGYVMGLDPTDPDRCWVIPEESSHLRAVCEGRLRVYETVDAGQTWKALAEGLPQEQAWVTVLREALATDGLAPCGVYFGTSTGHLFGSADGIGWQEITRHLPKILSVEVTVLPA